MLSVDFSTVALGVIGIAAVFSAPATAVINNRHLEKMKRLEYEHADKLEREAREREIYEGYVRAAGAYIKGGGGGEARADFGSHSALLSYHVPEEIRQSINELERLSPSNSSSKCEDKLFEIVTQLRELRSLP